MDEAVTRQISNLRSAIMGYHKTDVAELLADLETQRLRDRLEEAQKRNDILQDSYDRMLMDTGKMKSELIELYRRHLALLSEIPGKGDAPTLEAENLETL